AIKHLVSAIAYSREERVVGRHFSPPLRGGVGGGAWGSLTLRDALPERCPSFAATLCVAWIHRSLPRRSTACLRLTRRLDGLWKAFSLLIAIPAPVRDWAYDLFAQHRYRLFGRTESCLMPT